MNKTLLWLLLVGGAFWYGRSELPATERFDSLEPVREVEWARAWDNVPSNIREEVSRWPEVLDWFELPRSEQDSPSALPSVSEQEPDSFSGSTADTVVAMVPPNSPLRSYYLTPGFSEFTPQEARLVEEAIQYGYGQLRSAEWYRRAQPRDSLRYPKIFGKSRAGNGRSQAYEYVQQMATGRTDKLTVYGKSRFLTDPVLALNSLTWVEQPLPSLRRAEIVLNHGYLQKLLRRYQTGNAYLRQKAVRDLAGVMIHEIAHSYAHAHPKESPYRDDESLFINWLTEAITDIEV